MSISCRACGEPIYNSNPRNIFEKEFEEILHNIEALTGITLYYESHLPAHICSCCFLDLDHSMAFRDRCLETHKQLMKVKPAGNIVTKNICTQYYQDDPLDNDRIDENVDSFVEYEDHTKEDFYEESSENVESIIRVTNSKRLSPRSKFIRCFNRNKVRQKEMITRNLLGTNTSRNIQQNELTPPHTEQKPYVMQTMPAKNSELSKNRVRSNLTKKYQRDPRSDIIVSRNIRKRPQRPLEKKFVCDQCGLSFRDLSNMKDHAIRHSGVKKFECEECGFKFFTRPLLMLHVRVHHKGEKPFVCKYCGMAFRNSPSRCRHERKYHAHQLPFECELCNKTFISKIGLVKHKENHNIDNETFSCVACNKTFTRATALRKHNKTQLHLNQVKQVTRSVGDENNLSEIGVEDLDIDFADSIIEEIDE